MWVFVIGMRQSQVPSYTRRFTAQLAERLRFGLETVEIREKHSWHSHRSYPPAVWQTDTAHWQSIRGKSLPTRLSPKFVCSTQAPWSHASYWMQVTRAVTANVLNVIVMSNVIHLRVTSDFTFTGVVCGNCWSRLRCGEQVLVQVFLVTTVVKSFTQVRGCGVLSLLSKVPMQQGVVSLPATCKW